MSEMTETLRADGIAWLEANGFEKVGGHWERAEYPDAWVRFDSTVGGNGMWAVYVAEDGVEWNGNTPRQALLALMNTMDIRARRCDAAAQALRTMVGVG